MTAVRSAARPAPPVRRGRGWLAWAPVLAVTIALLVFGSLRTRPPTTDAERVNAIALLIKCPECVSQSAGASDAEVSRQIRLDIAKRMSQGESEEQIQDYYRGRYGDEVLLTPSASGIGGVVWALPVVVLVCAMAGLVAAFRRWRRTADDGPRATSADEAIVSRALQPSPPDQK